MKFIGTSGSVVGLAGPVNQELNTKTVIATQLVGCRPAVKAIPR